MKKIWIILSLISIYSLQIQAQDTITYKIPRLRLGIEAGVDFLDGSINKPDLIRENRSFYFDNVHDYDYYCGFVSDYQNYSCFFIGIKPEYVLSKRFVITSGLRFYYNKTAIKSDKEYFLWNVSELETSSNYIKINRISQKNYYLGVPIEMRFYPREKDHIVRQYFIFGTTLNFLLTSENEITFQNPKMEKYNSQVSKYLEKPNLFLGTIYAGVGVKFGKSKYPFGSIEFRFPVISYGANNKKSFVQPANIFGCGFSTTLQIPITRKHQLTYTVID